MLVWALIFGASNKAVAMTCSHGVSLFALSLVPYGVTPAAACYLLSVKQRQGPWRTSLTVHYFRLWKEWLNVPSCPSECLRNVSFRFFSFCCSLFFCPFPSDAPQTRADSSVTFSVVFSEHYNVDWVRWLTWCVNNIPLLITKSPLGAFTVCFGSISFLFFFFCCIVLRLGDFA